MVSCQFSIEVLQQLKRVELHVYLLDNLQKLQDNYLIIKFN